MRELKEYFVGKGEVKGFIFNQIKKTDYGFIYEINSGDKIYYEVFKRIENTMYNCISYPTSKAFGLWAWTIESLEKAQEKLKEIELQAIYSETNSI